METLHHCSGVATTPCMATESSGNLASFNCGGSVLFDLIELSLWTSGGTTMFIWRSSFGRVHFVDGLPELRRRGRILIDWGS